MIVSQVASICKKSKNVSIYEDTNGTQWIGDDIGIYPAYELPIMTEDQVCAMFGITEKQKDKMCIVSHETKNPLMTDSSCENELEIPLLSLSYSGYDLIPLYTQIGLMLIDSRYLRPIGKDAEYLKLYERITADGKLCVLAKIGMVTQGIIIPFNSFITESLTRELNILSEMCNKAYEIRAGIEK